MPHSPDDVRTSVAAYYAAVRSADVDAIAPLFAADAVMRDPVGAPALTDEATRRQRYAGIGAAFASFQMVEQDVFVGGDEAAVRWNTHARTHTDKDVRFDGITTFSFDAERRITAMSAYFDLAALVAAMQA